MSLFGEFHVPATELAFHDSLQAEPELLIEIERVVASKDLLTPYFWVSHISPDAFEATAHEDPTIDQLERLDEFDTATLYRADWTDRVDALVYAYTHLGAAILDAEGQNDEWILRMRFDDREALMQFNEYLEEIDIQFDLQRLYQVSHPRSGGQFGLTPKQVEALTTAWEMGYFKQPREADTMEVADQLGIAPQSLSDRLRRAQQTLIGEALRVEGPSDNSLSDYGDR